MLLVNWRRGRKAVFRCFLSKNWGSIQCEVWNWDSLIWVACIDTKVPSDIISCISRCIIDGTRSSRIRGDKHTEFRTLGPSDWNKVTNQSILGRVGFSERHSLLSGNVQLTCCMVGKDALFVCQSLGLVCARLTITHLLSHGKKGRNRPARSRPLRNAVIIVQTCPLQIQSEEYVIK